MNAVSLAARMPTIQSGLIKKPRDERKRSVSRALLTLQRRGCQACIIGLTISIACARHNPIAPDLSTTVTQASRIPAFSHIVVLVMENKEFDRIIGAPSAPYINSLADTYGSAVNYTGVAHPSLPNYMALTGGVAAFVSDCPSCTINAVNIVDEVEASGRRWRAYLEDMPAPCTTNNAGNYDVDHNPFLHYIDILANRVRCEASVVPLTELAADLQTGRLPDYVWITPNNCHNMHDCSVAAGDTWLAGFVPSLIASMGASDWVLFVVWDEGNSDQGGGGHVPAIVVAPGVHGIQSATLHSHYGLVRTIEDAWNLKPLGQTGFASAMAEFWH
ncbi:MAG: hypothetical protein AUH43_04370 [Acidobacteria bacterium 13_1_40CM_65_14]|nr:MAG: hypothetical protein AUH43_04370 [Acidobacteria bacterium 13_1_40CM_65_14]